MHRPRGPETLRQAPPAGLRHGRYVAWQHRASAWAGSGSVRGLVRTRVSSGPLPGLNQGLGILLLGISGPYWEWSRPLLRGPGPVPGVWFALVKVLNPARKSGLCIQGSGPFLWGSGPTIATLEYIVFHGHAAALEPSTWSGQVFVRHATKHSRMDIAPLYCSNGYPFSRLLTRAPHLLPFQPAILWGYALCLQSFTLSPLDFPEFEAQSSAMTNWIKELENMFLLYK
jgi:hypothetical protein